MTADYEILAKGAALADLPARGRIAVEGADRISYLHAVLTNDIASLTPGRGCYAAYLTPQGRTISDMIVLVLEDLVWLDVPAAMAAPLVERFDQTIFTEDVRVRDVSETLAGIGVYGPDAARVVGSLSSLSSGPPDLDRLAPHHTVSFRVGDARLTVGRVEQELGPGFSIYVEREKSAEIADRLRKAGANAVQPDVVEIRRIEAGLPRFGADMDQHTIPLESGIEQRAISFTKGCYPGQEVIIRVLHRGQGRVAKRLMGLVVNGQTVPSVGDPLVSEADEEIGRITSAVLSPALGAPIALGYLRRDRAVAGARVGVEHDGRRLEARVTALPFVDFSSRPHIKVVAAVIERDDRFLVTRRGPGAHLEGYWEFPGGKCEDSESLVVCLQRELHEELGVDSVVSNEILHVDHPYPDRIVELHFFRSELKGEPRAALGQEMRWATREELDELPFPPADAELIQRLLSRSAGL